MCVCVCVCVHPPCPVRYAIHAQCVPCMQRCGRGGACDHPGLVTGRGTTKLSSPAHTCGSPETFRPLSQPDAGPDP